MMKTNTNKSATGTNRSNVVLKRDAKGRFVSASSKPSKSVVVKASKSSFIKSMVVNTDNTVSVVTVANPKTVYTYSTTKRGLAAVQNALTNGTSLGTVFNKQLRGREISRTIFQK